MHPMKRINHLNSVALLALAVLLAVILVLPELGIAAGWKPKTTPYRLVSNPFIGWSLVVVLGAGLVLIRAGSELSQCMSALVFVGLVFGLAIATGLFWDPWLSPALVFAVLPIQKAATQGLQSLASSRVAGSKR
ncbi:hypothetical protein [Acidovorax sp. sic0104]|uniref:hypothetical protein n=2 Tax=Acidovorax sp. sic0104 TaxID=2854784 RepID=UPI001C477512|nr:hypothetical protein [Acidovorax sp. sic0104]